MSKEQNQEPKNHKALNIGGVSKSYLLIGRFRGGYAFEYIDEAANDEKIIESFYHFLLNLLLSRMNIQRLYKRSMRSAARSFNVMGELFRDEPLMTKGLKASLKNEIDRERILAALEDNSKTKVKLTSGEEYIIR